MQTMQSPPRQGKRLLRDAFLHQITLLSAQKAPAGRFSGSKCNSSALRAYPPTCLYAPAIPAPPPISRDATLSPLLDRDPWGGTQGIPREPRGLNGSQGGTKGSSGPRAQGKGALRAPSVPKGPLGPLGVIPKPFRVDGHYERIATTSGGSF